MKKEDRFITITLSLFLIVALIFATVSFCNTNHIKEIEQSISEAEIETSTAATEYTTVTAEQEKPEKQNIVHDLRKRINELESEIDKKLGDNYTVPKNILKDIIKSICNSFTFAEKNDKTVLNINSLLKGVMTKDCYNEFLKTNAIGYKDEDVLSQSCIIRNISFDEIDTDNPKALVMVNYEDDYQSRIRTLDFEFNYNQELGKYKVSRLYIST